LTYGAGLESAILKVVDVLEVILKDSDEDFVYVKEMKWIEGLQSRCTSL
jgi:hypothetical protein